MTTVVVGAGQAGLQFAVALRDLDPDEPITMIGAEAAYPYQRPPLSKAVLSGKVDIASLALRNEAFYERSGIGLALGHPVTDVRLAPGGEGGRVITEAGRAHNFDNLVLAVGTRPRLLEVPGADLDGVGYLRTAADALQLRRQLADRGDVVIIGGGFIGLEVAAAAQSLGNRVVVIEAADRLMGRAVHPVVSAFYAAAHERRGVEIRLGAGVTELRGTNGKVNGVVLSDGSVLRADTVVIGIGVIANTELAEQIGVECDGGIVVDRHCRTSIPGVLAVGDCTVSVGFDGQRLRLESVQNATSQGKNAARTVFGTPEPSREIPTFWSDQYDLKLQMAGVLAEFDDYTVIGDLAMESFCAEFFRHGSLIAVQAVNRVPDYLHAKRAIEQSLRVAAPQR